MVSGVQSPRPCLVVLTLLLFAGSAGAQGGAAALVSPVFGADGDTPSQALPGTGSPAHSPSGFETPARNPWLADGPYPMSHHNPAQTDVSTEHGPTRGKDLVASDVKTVPVTWSSSPLVKERGGETTVIAGTATGLVKIRATGEAFEQISVLAYPGDADHSDVTPQKT